MSDDLTEVQAAVVPDGFVINLWQRGFGRTVGPFYSKRDPITNDEIMAFRVEEHHANGMGNCHGGMLMSFADMAWGRVISNQREIGWVTVRLTTDFLSGGHMGEWIEGSSEIIAEQDDVFTVRGRIWCAERTLMTGTGVYKGIRSIQRKAGEREKGASKAMAMDPAIKEGAPVGYYDDDRPVPSEPGSLPPEVQAPLLPFRGREPDAPAWFLDAIAQEPERSFVTSKGSKLELLTWGEVGKPGLLLVHGNSAHADWWSFIAPYLAKDYRVASMSLAGMGASDWRETYAFQDFAEDAEACAQAAGLYAAGKPVYVGHSFGGSQVFFAAAAHPERMKAAVMVDVGFGGPPADSPEGKRMMEEQAKRVANIPTPDRAQKVYPTIQAALARFRFMPPQAAGNLFIADFIARRSLKRAPMEDGSGEGWTWRFDPNMWNKLDRTAMNQMMVGGKPKVDVPLAHIFGDRSVIITRKVEGQTTPLPDDILEIAIPDSAHHVMVDQPLALVAALRSLLAVWPG